MFLNGGFLFYDARFSEKSPDLMCPKENISFYSIGFYNTFRFGSLRSQDFVAEDIADILGYSGCKG